MIISHHRWPRALGVALVAGVLGLAPRETAATCAPNAVSIFPASGVAGTSVTATISGSALDAASLSVFGEEGLATSVQSSSSTAISVRLDLDATAVPGERILFIETPGGTTGVAFAINALGGPVVDGVTPSLVLTQGEPLAAVVSGAGLESVAASSVTVSGTGVSVTAATASPDGTTVNLGFTAAADAPLGTRAVTITVDGGSAVLQLVVQRPPPTVDSVQPAAGEVGKAVNLSVVGDNLKGAALVVTGSGVAVGDVTTDDSSLDATLTIDPAATPSSEPRLLIVTTESGQATAEFFVVAADVPTVTSVEPGAGEPGTTVSTTLRGLRLNGGSVSEVSADLTLQNVQVVDDETITLDVVIAGGAATDVDHTLTVTTGAGSAMATFRVIATGDPFIGSVSPPFGNRGTTITLFVRGVNLGLTVPGTGVDVSGPKITESNATVVDNETVRVTLDIDPTASVGYRDVTVELTNAKTATKSPALRVNVPGTLPAIDDVSPALIEPGMTTEVLVTGTNFTGGGALVSGEDTTVTDTIIDDSGTLLMFDVALEPDAAADTRSVVVATENGTARCGLASDPAPPPLVPAKLVKTGARFTVSGSSYRLVVFEFSLSSAFPDGDSTVSITDLDGDLTLTRLDAFRIGRAFRERHSGFVRARAVTASNRFAVSTVHRLRR